MLKPFEDLGARIVVGGSGQDEEGQEVLDGRVRRPCEWVGLKRLERPSTGVAVLAGDD